MKNINRFRQGRKPNKRLIKSYCATTLDAEGKPVMKSYAEIEFESRAEHGPRREAFDKAKAERVKG